MRTLPLLLVVLGGCYSFSARTSTHIRSVAIPFFENRTDRAGLETRLTEALARGFLEEGDLRVVDERVADSVLRGVITGYEHKAVVFDQRERVSTTVDITYRDLVRGATVWEQKGLTAWGQYALGGEQRGTEEDGEREAIQRLVREVLARSIETW